MLLYCLGKEAKVVLKQPTSQKTSGNIYKSTWEFWHFFKQEEYDIQVCTLQLVNLDRKTAEQYTAALYNLTIKDKLLSEHVHWTLT